MKFAIATCYTPNLAAQNQPIAVNNYAYCKKHGYEYYLEIKDWDNQRERGFSKIDFVRRMMELHPEIDVFCWMDNDAIVMNHTVRLESFVDGEHDVFLAEDWNGINSGVFLVKNNEQGRKFLDRVWNYTPNPRDARPPGLIKFTEQGAMSDICPAFKTKICHHSLFDAYLVGPEANNDWRSMGISPGATYTQHVGPLKYEDKGRFKQGDFILHLVCVPPNDRPNVIKQCIEKVIK